MQELRTWTLILLCSLSAMPATVAADSPTDAILSGQHGLESVSDMPWYDSDTDSLRRIDVQPNEDDVKRLSQWATDGNTQANRSTTPTTEGTFWGTLLRAFVWILLGSLLALLIWALIWAATRYEWTNHEIESVVTQQDDLDIRHDDLPVPLPREHKDLLAAAHAFYNAGNLGQAIVYAFAHQLVELDKHHLIRLSRGKTNRQYLSELRAHPRFAEILSPTMLAFEDVFFGHHEISRQRFQVCWDDLDRFHQQLEQVAL